MFVDSTSMDDCTFGCLHVVLAPRYNDVQVLSDLVNCASLDAQEYWLCMQQSHSGCVCVLLCRYGPHYVWAQLSSWFKQTVYDPTASLSADRRGTLSLPEVESCYTTKEKYDAKVGHAAFV